MTSEKSMTDLRLAQLTAARRAAVIRLRVDLGLSSGAIARLDIEDVDRQGRRLWIRRRGRLDKESRSIAEPTLAALEVWLEVRGTVASVHETALFVMLSGRSCGHRMSGYNLLQVAARSFIFIEQHIGEIAGADRSLPRQRSPVAPRRSRRPPPWGPKPGS